MSSVAVPPPIIFDLSVGENIRIRKALFKANGMRLLGPILAANAIVAAINVGLRLYRHDPAVWMWVCSAVVSVCLVLVFMFGWLDYAAIFLRPQSAKVTFTESGIEIESRNVSGKPVKRFPFAAIRSVRMTPQALLLSKRVFPLVIIPTIALADDGREVMTFFESHLVGGRSLRRSNSSSTILINTKSA